MSRSTRGSGLGCQLLVNACPEWVVGRAGQAPTLGFLLGLCIRQCPGPQVSGPTSPSASQLLSPSNVAVYGGLCALATFDRQELQRNVISSR